MAVRLLVLVGPTACGKTRMAVEAAHALGSEIVSADSRQVYRGLDIGAGKDLDEYRRVAPAVRYHLIDIADPRLPYSVFHYQRDCYRLLAALHRRPEFRDGTPLVMAGGSGLYVESVLRGYRIADVPEDPELRATLMARGHVELDEELRRTDPERWRRTDVSSRKRLVRALEIAARGADHAVPLSPAQPVAIEHDVCAVRIPRAELERRIDARLDARLREGLIEEVARLLDDGVSERRMTQLGLEYREVSSFLTGAKTERQMVEDLRRAIRRLAKRQMTWFRGMPRRGIEPTWIDPGDAGAIIDHRWRGRSDVR